jgi:hypothetical protein
MKNKRHRTGRALTSELLVLPDGRVLVHNLTPSFAGLLRELNPHDEQLGQRNRLSHITRSALQMP